MRVIWNWEETGLIQGPLQSGSYLSSSGQFTSRQLCQVQTHFLDPLLLESLDLHQTHFKIISRYVSPPPHQLNNTFCFRVLCIRFRFDAITIQNNGTIYKAQPPLLPSNFLLSGDYIIAKVPKFLITLGKEATTKLFYLQVFWLAQMLCVWLQDSEMWNGCQHVRRYYHE